MTAAIDPRRWWLAPGKERHRCAELNREGERCKFLATEPGSKCRRHLALPNPGLRSRKLPPSGRKPGGKRIPLTGVTVGRVTVLSEFEEDGVQCVAVECKCGAREKRWRSSVLNAISEGANSQCKACSLKTRHRHHNLVRIQIWGAGAIDK